MSNKIEYFMRIAKEASTQSTCLHRQVGCVLVNYNRHIIATGYNGAPRGIKHCTSRKVCQREGSQSGKDLDLCIGTHAEQNALLQCHDVDAINQIYVTTFPCIHCVKLLINTSAKVIYYIEEYKNSERALALWQESGKSLWRLVI